MDERAQSGQLVRDALRLIRVGEPTSYGGMTVLPLYPTGDEPRSQPVEYRLLAEAMADGSVTIREHKSATVPELVLKNDGDADVLILAGEEIVGGQQNRIVNTTILSPAHRRISIPVSCVEVGRWHPVADRFSSGEISYYALKRAASAQVRESLRDRQAASADQGAIWSEIADRQMSESVHSHTGAMNDIFEHRQTDLKNYTAAFLPVDGAVGLVIGLGGQVASAELFDKPRTAGLVWSRLIRSYAMDADGVSEVATISSRQAIDYLELAQLAEYVIHESIGHGDDVRFDGPTILGASLVHALVPVYTTIFPKGEDSSTIETRIARRRTRRGFLE